LKHKWIESEKAGHVIGFELAMTGWILKHRSRWRKGQMIRPRRGAWRAAALKSAMQKAVEAQAQEISKIAIGLAKDI
jgi:hypothetical protein